MAILIKITRTSFATVSNNCLKFSACDEAVLVSIDDILISPSIRIVVLLSNCCSTSKDVILFSRTASKSKNATTE